ncbi:MAG: TIGR04086 family membrane protein [Acidimicrobiales bacterium]|nr:TIGR04086 family membrane protein [Acidimicrobiales bacterium]
MKLHRLTVMRGAASALVVGVIAALANVVLAAQDPKPAGWLNLTFLALVVAFFLGGVVAGREAPHDSARHGAAAGFVAFLPVEAIGLLGRSDRGEPIQLGSIIFLGLLAAVAGTLGALVGARRNQGDN